MFEPLPSLIRLERERQGLTQDRLAKLAGVSRGQLIAFERGENVSLAFLIKVANALQLTELRIGELHLRESPPDLTMLVVAGNAISAAKRVVDQATGISEELKSASASVNALLDRAMKPRPETGVEDAARHIASTPPEKRRATGRALRDLAEAPDAVVRTARSKRTVPAKTTQRRRVR